MRLDHTIAPSKDKEATARFFTDILGFQRGQTLPEAQFVYVDDTLTIRCDEKYSDRVHLAFLVSADELGQIADRAKARGVPYGSRANLTDNAFGEYGGGPRCYFTEPGGSSIELVTVAHIRD